MSIGVFMRGIKSESAPQNAVHSSMTIVKPAQIPRLNGSALLIPSRPALDMLIRLFGPGVTAVTTA